MHMTDEELRAARQRDIDADRRIKPADPGQQERDDADERRRTLAGMLDDDVATLAALAFLLGCPRGTYGDKNGTVARRLLNEIAEKRLRTFDNPKFTGGYSPEVRRNPTVLMLRYIGDAIQGDLLESRIAAIEAQVNDAA